MLTEVPGLRVAVKERTKVEGPRKESAMRGVKERKREGSCGRGSAAEEEEERMPANNNGAC